MGTLIKNQKLMNKINLGLLLISVSIISQSCFTYGEFTQSQYTSVTNSSNCQNKPSTMHLFFESEQPNTSYKKIGIVEAQGREFASYEEVLDHLKYQAWQNCANALLHIRSGYTDRVQGIVSPNEYIEEVYTSKYFEAVAVKINVDDSFIQQYGYGEDMSFINRVQKDHQIKNQQTNMEIVGSAAIGIFTILDLFVNDN